MKTSLKVITLLSFVVLLCGKASGQSLSPVAITSGGGNFVDNEHSLSYSIGEVVVPTFEKEEFILTQGFQQPLEGIFISTPEIKASITSVNIFPNPFNSKLNIQIDAKLETNFHIYIYDLSGRMIYLPNLISQSAGVQVHQIDVENLPSGIYIARIIEESGISQSDFKLIKM